MAHNPLPPEDLAHILTHTRDVFAQLRHARIFLTGGTGFFGHSLLESLLHANRDLHLGLKATVLTRDPARFRAHSPHVTEDPAVTLVEGDTATFPFPAEPHTHVIHAATDSGGQQSTQPAHSLADSILAGTRHTLQFALATGASRLLYTSSGAVYGRASATETHIPETSTASPDPLLLSSSYDEAKRMSEHLCVAYTHDTGLQAVIARPFAFVGPHLPLDRHFAIGNFIGAAIQNLPLHIRGDGTPLRSWLYTADLSIWLWHLLLRGQPNRAYNVGSEHAHTIAEAADLTARTLRPNATGTGSALSVQIDGAPHRAPAELARQGGPHPPAPMNSYVPSTARAREELGLRELIPLAEAIRRTAAWHGYTPR